MLSKNIDKEKNILFKVLYFIKMEKHFLKKSVRKKHKKVKKHFLKKSVSKKHKNIKKNL